MRDSLWGIRCVWLRYFVVFKKSFLYYLVTSFLDPILYLISFGFGVGSLVGLLHTQGMHVTYRSFIFSGVIAQTVLFQGFFEGAYGAFIRMYYQRIFQAMATTPITLSEVLWGELLWDASKSTVAALLVVVIGVAVGEFRWTALPAILPACFLFSLLFSAMGLTAAAYARIIEELSYPQFLVVMPMFLFCGVFFPLDTFPVAVRVVVWILPLTSVGSLTRTITLGFPFEWWAVPITLGWTVLFIWLGRRAMVRRLIK
ncbi:MAG: ABC transporter permease [Proteobacteria bacterium]|nr:ABC transporter permease [Pseudomonadota bacterium]